MHERSMSSNGVDCNYMKNKLTVFDKRKVNIQTLQLVTIKFPPVKITNTCAYNLKKIEFCDTS